jgi:chloride channel protein, CIC family
MNLEKGLIKDVKIPEYVKIIIYSIFIGVFVGLAAVLFHNAIGYFNKIFFIKTAQGFFFLGALAVIIIPALGMIIQAIMIYSFPEIAKNKGVPEVIKAVAIKGGFISFKSTLFHFIAPVICIGSGNTVGPEGPAAQLGGGVASKITQYLHLSDSQRKVFTAAGAGAAIAAIFNTPLGGIFFALEVVLLHEIQASTFSALILSSVTASTVSRTILGNDSIFHFSTPSIGTFHIYYLYIILGIFAGIISIGFIKYSGVVDKLLNKHLIKILPRWVIMLIAGLIMGACGYFYKEIFGVGYEGINLVLSERLAWQIVLVLLVMKFLLVPMILHSGGFGGTFAPSLFMGACFGFLFSTVLSVFFGLHVDKTAFILVSMGAFLGGINSIPIASILMIFEMTKDYTYILPLMLAVIIATIIVQIVFKDSVHLHHLYEIGYRFSTNKDTNILNSVMVDEVMNTDVELIPEDLTLMKLFSRLIESPHHTFYTINKQGKLTGTITENELRPLIAEYEQVREMLVAGDISRKEVVTVFKTDPLDHVMKLFENYDVDEFPVVRIEEPDKIIGTILKAKVISVFNKEHLKHNLAEGFARELRVVDKKSSTKVADGYAIIERKVKKEFVGKTLSQIRLRNNYGLEVLMIKKQGSIYENKSEVFLPDANYILTADDMLVLFGSDENISKCCNWE